MIAPPLAPQPRAPQPRAPRPAPVYGRQPNLFLRSLKLAIITAVLIAVPTAVAYLAFHYAQGTPAWPLSITW